MQGVVERLSAHPQIKISIFVFAFSAIYAMVYIFQGWSGGAATLDLEVSCVTGLPARTARPFVPSFFVRKEALQSASAGRPDAAWQFRLNRTSV
jgi:hypothetical protein